MIQHILLDSAPLGLLASPNAGAKMMEISVWSANCLASGHLIYVPEIMDYELRRELLRAGKTASVRKLDSLRSQFEYRPITTSAMLLAAELWAQSRRIGLPTGDPKKLDVDVILAAQALTLDVAPQTVVVATTNVDHLSRFARADLWTNIR